MYLSIDFRFFSKRTLRAIPSFALALSIMIASYKHLTKNYNRKQSLLTKYSYLLIKKNLKVAL